MPCEIVKGVFEQKMNGYLFFQNKCYVLDGYLGNIETIIDSFKIHVFLRLHPFIRWLFEIKTDVEEQGLTTSPQSYGWCSIPIVKWLQFGPLATDLPLRCLQHLAITWLPFTSFPAGFLQAKSMRKLAEGHKSLLKVVPAAFSPGDLRLHSTCPYSVALIHPPLSLARLPVSLTGMQFQQHKKTLLDSHFFLCRSPVRSLLNNPQRPCLRTAMWLLLLSYGVIQHCALWPHCLVTEITVINWGPPVCSC